jgi:uncharacterized protein (TIGR02145 family)
MNMKKIHLVPAILFLACFLISCSSSGDEEQQNPSSSSTGSSSSDDTPVYRQFDSVSIGGQTWMAENLHYPISGSKCYDNDPANCEMYGHLYDWATAMDISLSCNYSDCSDQIQPRHRGICPEGWHMPSNVEWDKLYRDADGDNGTSSLYESPVAGRYLKTTSGWKDNGNGEDAYGFAALPGGNGYNGAFRYVGFSGYWWSANEDDSNNSYFRYISHHGDDAYLGANDKRGLYSVRCVRD